MFLVISYDIKENKLRSQTSNILLNYGKRVQFSVFECNLTIKQINSLKEKLKRLDIGGKGTIRIYPLCKSCKSSINIIGDGEIEEERSIYVV